MARGCSAYLFVLQAVGCTHNSESALVIYHMLYIGG